MASQVPVQVDVPSQNRSRLGAHADQIEGQTIRWEQYEEYGQVVILEAR